MDNDYAGGWSQPDAYNAENAMLRTGYVLCCCKLQAEIALSTT